MSLKDILKNSYIEWLSNTIDVSEVNEAIELTSPMLDRHNDFMQVYILPDGDSLRITDDGYTLNDLQLSGCEVYSSPKRKEIFYSILNGHGVKVSKDDELTVGATIQNFPQKVHLLLQAMVTVNDMFMTTRSTVQRLFLEDVEEFIEENDIRATENANFSGISGYSYRFDFVIPKSKSQPERFIQTMNNPTHDLTKSLLFAWGDTKEVRKPGSRLYAFLNDSNRKVSNEIIGALTKYDVQPILWSERKQFIEELKA